MIGNFFKAVGKFVWNKIQQIGWAGGFNLKNAFFVYTTAVGVKGFLQAKEMLAKGQDIMANKTAAGGKMPVIYGTRRVGAQIVYMDTAQNRSRDLFVVYAISVGECEEILGRTIEIDGNSILDGNIYKGGGYVGSDKISSGNGSLNTASQVGDNQYSQAGTLGTDPTKRYSFVFNLHHGASSQAADPMLRASIPTEWTINHKLNGICYIAASFDYDKKGMYKGVPQITVQVKGKKVFDPRDSSTKWSSNPALCFLDYIQNDEYGKGLATSQINMTTISAAATACEVEVDQPYYNDTYQDLTWSGTAGNDFIVINDNDDWWQNKVDEVIDIRDSNDASIFSNAVSITGSTRYQYYDSVQENRLYIDDVLANSYTNEAGNARAKVKRFHCNGYIDTNKNVMDNAKELLANMRGIFLYIDGKYELQIEDTGTSTFSITDDHIIADAGISVDYGNKDKKANKVVIEFFNANKKYELDTATVLHDASPEYYSDDGEVLEVKAEFPYVTDPYIAYNMGKAILTRSRNQTTMQFLGTPEMYKLNVGDIVSLTYSGLGFSGKVCRVEALELQANGLVSVSLIEYFDVYTWEVPAQEPVEIIAHPPSIGALHPPEANSIVFTDTDASSINRPTLTWTEPTDFPVRQYRVDVVDSSANNVFSKIVDTPSVDLAFLPKAANYEASITSFNGVGIESNASTKTFTIADDPVKTTEVEMNGVTLSTVESYGTVAGQSGNWVKFTNQVAFIDNVDFEDLVVFNDSVQFENAPTFADGLSGQGLFNISAGSIQFGSYTPSTTTNNLYNVGGSLYWNGQALGTGTGDITAVVAGTNLNGGGTSGSVTLNLDSTITGNHTFSNNLIIGGDLTVQGTTTTVNTDDLNVKDKNITLNYSTGDSSASANGAGITIQDAVSATQDATLTWNTANDSFNFSHPLNVTGAVATTGNITLSSGGTQVKFTGTAGPFGLEFGDTESNPNFRLYYRTTPNTLTFENSGQTAKHTFDLDGDYTAVRDVSVGRNLDVTGNIGVTGTVDGRDIADDGNKLDGIEANATTDQTQAEINALGITAIGLSGTPNITVGTINSGAITSTSSITAASGGNAIQLGTDGNIEIARTSGGAYIDFKDSTSEDFDQRIQATSTGHSFSGTINSGDSSTSGGVRSYYSDGSYTDLKGYGLEFNRNSSYIRPTTDGTKNLYIGGSDASKDWNIVAFRSVNGLYMTGTQFLTTDRNLVNIGSISSGAITSSGNIAINAGNKILLSGAGDNTHHIYHDSSTDYDVVNYSTGFQLEHYSSGTQFTLDGSTGNATFAGDVSLSTGDLAVEGTIELGNNYIIPNTNGTAGQVLKYPTAGSSTLVWSDIDTGAVTSISNNANNRILTATGGTTINGESGLTFDGATLGVVGDISLGDNKKIYLGTGNDTEIYFDGSNSYFLGTGNTFYTGATSVTLASGVSVGSQTYLTADYSNGVKLYHTGAIKAKSTATGFDVTGTVTADGLTVDAGTDAIINGSSGQGLQFQRGGVSQVRIDSVNNDGGVYHAPAGKNHTFKTDGVNRVKFATGGDISFYEDTGTTQALFWDASAESLGIGDTSPDAKLTVQGDVLARDEFRGEVVNYASNQDAPYLIASTSGYTGATTNWNTYGFQHRIKSNANGAPRITIDTSNGEAFTVTSNNRIGIGTDSPEEKMQLLSSGNTLIRVTSGTSSIAGIDFGDTDDTDVGRIRYLNSSNALQFSTQATERMRIDSSGNLLVATTDTTLLNNTSGGGFSVSSNGFTQIAKQGVDNADPVLILNQTGVEGEILRFYKDGGIAGSIGSNSDALYISSPYGNDSGLRFVSSIIAPSTTTGANRDAAIDLGYSSGRFKDLHLSGTANVGSVTSSGNIFMSTNGSILRNSGGALQLQSDASQVILRSNNNTALTLDTSQNATFAGTISSGAITSTGAVLIDVDNQANGALRITANQTNPNNDFYFAQEIVSTLSGTTATTADREQGGLYLDINSTATGGDTTNEHRAYGVFVDLDSTGDADVIVGGYFNATATPSTGQTTEIIGVQSIAEDNGGAGNVTNVFGAKFQAQSDNATSDANNLYGSYNRVTNTADSGVITKAVGVYGEIDIAANSGDIYGTSYVFNAEYDNNTGSAPTHTAALFYGNYSGTLPTSAYGVFIPDAVRNRFDGSITTGRNSTTTAAYGFNSDLNTGMYSPADHQIGFLTSGGQRLKITSATATFSTDIELTGTITSGAITSTGDIKSDKFAGASYPNNSFLDLDDDNGVGSSTNNTTLASIGNMNFIIDTNANVGADKFHWLKDNTAPNSATALMDLDKNANLVLRNGTVTGQSGGFFGGNLELYNSSDLIIGTGGEIKYGTTVVIDSSRNLTNIGTITSGAITANHSKSSTANPILTLKNTSTTNEGRYLQFLSSIGTNIGQIGHLDQTESNFFISTFGTGLKFESYITYKAVLPCNENGADSDNAIDLGSSSVRFDDVYATNGTIQTSDENEKQDIQALTDAEQRVATACKGLIRRFRWQDSVAEKDDNPESDETARYHFGVIAQDLQDAFTAEGLNASDYGMFISSTWEDGDGVEQTRLGVRYNELLSFIITTI